MTLSFNVNGSPVSAIDAQVSDGTHGTDGHRGVYVMLLRPDSDRTPVRRHADATDVPHYPQWDHPRGFPR